MEKKKEKKRKKEEGEIHWNLRDISKEERKNERKKERKFIYNFERWFWKKSLMDKKEKTKRWNETRKTEKEKKKKGENRLKCVS